MVHFDGYLMKSNHGEMSMKNYQNRLNQKMNRGNRTKLQCDFVLGFYFSSGDWLKRLMKRKEEETAREKRRVY